jgi:hypothetical protein
MIQNIYYICDILPTIIFMIIIKSYDLKIPNTMKMLLSH